MLSFVRQLPARDVLENLPIFRFGGIGWELCFQAVPPCSVFSGRQLPARDVLDSLAGNPLSGPEPRSRNKSRGHSPFSRLVPSASSADHQMTPAWFVPLFRAYALSRHSLAARLSGTPSAALRPKASRLSGLENELFSFEKNAACLTGELRAGALACDLGERRSQETHGAKLNVPSPQSGAA